MASKKGGLGRGLDSLFEDSSSSPDAEQVTTLPLGEIEPDPDQPRKTFAPQALDELAQSIAELGLLQPIAVRSDPAGRGYRIIAGERRWRAARIAGLAEVPVIIKEVTDEQAMELALIENLQREDLDPVEEALGYRQLMDKCGLTQEQVAQKLGRSRSSLANSLRLLNLPEEVRDLLRTGHLTSGHAKAILGLPAPLHQKAADLIVAGDLNVRQAEALCRDLAKPAPQPKPPVLRPSFASEVELSLREALGNEVKVDYKKGGKGTLTLHFYSDDQLSAFANLLGQYKQTN